MSFFRRTLSGRKGGSSGSEKGNNGSPSHAGAETDRRSPSPSGTPPPGTPPLTPTARRDTPPGTPPLPPSRRDTPPSALAAHPSKRGSGKATTTSLRQFSLESDGIDILGHPRNAKFVLYFKTQLRNSSKVYRATMSTLYELSDFEQFEDTKSLSTLRNFNMTDFETNWDLEPSRGNASSAPLENLGDKAVISVFKDAPTVQTLRYLALPYCNLSRASAQVLADFIRRAGPLFDLINVSGNPALDLAAKRILSCAVLESRASLNVIIGFDPVAHCALRDWIIVCEDAEKWEARLPLRARLDANTAAVLKHWKDAYERKRDVALDVPDAVRLRGPRAIAAYFSAASEGKDPSPRLVVAVVGAAEVGKTSLVESLASNNYSRRTSNAPAEKDQSRTILVNISEFTPSGTDKVDAPPVLTVRDFGGQAEYHSSNTLFQTRAGFTLIVVDASKYKSTLFEASCQFFIDKMQASGPGSLFSVVLTKTDLVSSAVEAATDIKSRIVESEADAVEALKRERSELLVAMSGTKQSKSELILQLETRLMELDVLIDRRPRMFGDILLVANEKQRGLSGAEKPNKTIAEVSRVLVTVALRDGVHMLTKHLSLIDRIEALRLKAEGHVAWVSLDEACSLCQSVGFAKGDACLEALAFLHDLGEIVWFGSGAEQKVVFLTPKAVMDAVKHVCRHDLLTGALEHILPSRTLAASAKELLKSKGLLLHSTLLCFPIWNDIAKDPAALQIMLSIVERAGIGFLIESDSNEPSLFVPSHVGLTLSAVTPVECSVKKASLQFCRVFQLPFLPPALLELVAARFHRLNFRCMYFRGGIDYRGLPLLDDPLHSPIQVLLELHRTSQYAELALRVFSSHVGDAAYHLGLVVSAIDEVLDGFGGLIVRRYVLDPEYLDERVLLEKAQAELAAGKQTCLSDAGNHTLALERVLPAAASSLSRAGSFRNAVKQVALTVPDGFTHHLFLSYMQAEGREVGLLHADFERHGLKVWFDQRVASSQRDVNGMRTGVTAAQAFVLFLTTSALTRPYVREELRTALKLGRPIVLFHENDPRYQAFTDFSGKNIPASVSDEIPNELKGDGFTVACRHLLGGSASIQYQREGHLADANCALVVRILKDPSDLNRRSAVSKEAWRLALKAKA